MSKHVVVDLEMCQVLRGMRCKEYRHSREIIQIGAVLLDENYNIIDKFSTFVRPEYGWITSEIEKLTGITAENLIGAKHLNEAMQEFANWIPDEDVSMVEWSDSDEKQLRTEIEAKLINNEKINRLIDSTVDCQRLFAEKMNESRQYNLTNALIAADIMPEGREHDGLADAYNTALLFAKLSLNEVLTLNPIYEKARSEDVEHLEFSISSLFNGINLAALPA